MIKEVIVVEGKHDTTAVKRAVEADTIETGGSAVGKDVLARIELAQRKRGVIILTDPDHAGERIRALVSSRVPGCKHAFLSQEEATLADDIGIENAKPEAIRQALASVRTEAAVMGTDFGWPELYAAGLAGTDGSARRRLRVGRKLRIGYANAKTFLKRCAMFGITRREVEAALAACDTADAAEGRLGPRAGEVQGA
ncbi:ribonuclease M5 [Paenibacillus sp.]|uniref:ribonuclease M5 n=1 Tax=Paenibacillus sp. TaxID=58172 RepID=UPI002D685660|nr:ribonuclease M5 [Paenibacillus sp.]HZG55816.1 ribonuclease M5 [Paenibacillus sp.]